MTTSVTGATTPVTGATTSGTGATTFGTDATTFGTDATTFGTDTTRSGTAATTLEPVPVDPCGILGLFAPDDGCWPGCRPEPTVLDAVDGCWPGCRPEPTVLGTGEVARPGEVLEVPEPTVLVTSLIVFCTLSVRLRTEPGMPPEPGALMPPIPGEGEPSESGRQRRPLPRPSTRPLPARTYLQRNAGATEPPSVHPKRRTADKPKARYPRSIVSKPSTPHFAGVDLRRKLELPAKVVLPGGAGDSVPSDAGPRRWTA